MKSPVPAVLGRTTRHFRHQMPQRIKELLAEFKVREQEERLVLALRQHELSNLCSTQGLVFGTGEILVGPKQKFYRMPPISTMHKTRVPLVDSRSSIRTTLLFVGEVWPLRSACGRQAKQGLQQHITSTKEYKIFAGR